MQDYLYSVIGFIAIAVQLIINYKVMFIPESNSGRIAGKMYRWLMLTIFAYYITDAMWGILAGLNWIPLLFVDTTVYYIAMCSAIVCYYRYFVEYLEMKNWKGRLFTWFGIVFFVLEIISLIINFFYPCFFWFDGSDAYVAGPIRYIALWVQVAMFAFSSLVTLLDALKTEGASRNRHLAIFFFSFIMLVAVIFQEKYPLLPFYALGCLLEKELNIESAELQEKMLYASLERIFIEQRIYKDKEFEQARSKEEAILHIEKRLQPFVENFIRPITQEDVARLLEIKMARILRYNVDDADRLYEEWQQRLDQINYHLAHLVEYTIEWFEHLKKTYGDKYPRLTELRNFENIVAAKVVANNAKLYVNKNEGYVGLALKKEEGVEFVCDCSTIDDIIIFFRNGEYKVTKVTEKSYVGKDIIHVGVFHKNDKRTVYNVVYRDGKEGTKVTSTDANGNAVEETCTGYFYMKRFSVNSVSRDKTYNLTQGYPGSRVFYFSANANGEGEVIRVALKQTNKKLRNMTFEKDFAQLAIKGRQSRGNLLTKYPVYRILLKHRGGSTLGGTPIWFDEDVARLNMDNHGRLLGEFFNEDLILVVNSKGEFYTTNFDLSNHYDNDIIRIEKFDADKIWTAALLDADEGGFAYLKRFPLVASAKPQSYLGENEKSKQLLLTDTPFPYLQVEFGGEDAEKPAIQIDAEEFIAVKSHKAKGKRISKQEVARIIELEPLRQPEPPAEEPVDGESNETPDNGDNDNNTDETGQLSLF